MYNKKIIIFKLSLGHSTSFVRGWFSWAFCIQLHTILQRKGKPKRVQPNFHPFTQLSSRCLFWVEFCQNYRKSLNFFWYFVKYFDHTTPNAIFDNWISCPWCLSSPSFMNRHLTILANSKFITSFWGRLSGWTSKFEVVNLI